MTALLWIVDRAVWVAAGLVVWVAVAAAVGLILGRGIRRHTPREDVQP